MPSSRITRRPMSSSSRAMASTNMGRPLSPWAERMQAGALPLGIVHCRLREPFHASLPKTKFAADSALEEDTSCMRSIGRTARMLSWALWTATSIARVWPTVIR